MVTVGCMPLSCVLVVALACLTAQHFASGSVLSDLTSSCRQPLVLLQTRTYRTNTRVSKDSRDVMGMLDMDSDGKVSKEEVSSFALAQGIDPGGIAREFSSLDTNQDGALQSGEIAPLLKAIGIPGPPASQAPSEEQRPSGVSLSGNDNHSDSASPSKARSPGASSDVPVIDGEPVVDLEPSEEPVAEASLVDEELNVTASPDPSESSAVVAAREVAADLRLQGDQESDALQKQAKATELRAKAATILMNAELKARSSAQNAAKAYIKSTIGKIEVLEKGASEAQMRAAALQSRADAETKEAFTAAATAASAFQKLGR